MILIAGDALIDMLPSEDGGFVPHCGGGALNTARALGRLGVDVGLCAGVSTDMFGAQIMDAVQDAQIRPDYLIRSDAPTTLAFVQLQDGQARYAFYDENTAGRMLPALPCPAPLPRAACFGGISLITEPCASRYEALARELAEAGVCVMLDPNIRPGLVRDAAPYRARLARMIGLSRLLRMSDEDLMWLCGPGDIVEQARAFLDQGPQAVWITLGAGGAMAVTPDGVQHADAVPTPVVDTVAAGDTFNAGILAGLSDHGALAGPYTPDVIRATLDLGCRAAAVTVSRSGVNPPTRSEL